MKRLMLFCAITALGYCASVAGEPAPQPRYLVTFERPFWVDVKGAYLLIVAAEGSYDSAREWVSPRAGFIAGYTIQGYWKDVSDGSFHATRVIEGNGTPHRCDCKVWARDRERQLLSHADDVGKREAVEGNEKGNLMTTNDRGKLAAAIVEMRECPFCGETGRLSCEYLEVRGYWTVSCADCGSTGPTEMSRRAAVLGWNGRAVTNLADQPQAEVKV